jgi:hypothetical protein
MNDIECEGMFFYDLFHGLQMLPAQVFVPGCCGEIDDRCLDNVDVFRGSTEIYFLGNGKRYEITDGNNP